MLELNVNGTNVALNVAPATPLIFVLRNDLGLKSVRLGCGLEQCGACKVIVDGIVEYSCVRPAADFVGRQITTVEGLADGLADRLADRLAEGRADGLTEGSADRLAVASGRQSAPGDAARARAWSALQQAVLKHNAAQCGYCLSGVLMAATALLARTAAPDDAAIRDALADHLCRCGAQPRLLRAVREAADALGQRDAGAV